MYCIQCGIELSEGQTLCPICHTRVYHPDIPVSNARPTYPKGSGEAEVSPRGLLFVLTIFAALCVILPLICELIFGGGITWSGYMACGVLLGYILFLLPSWFRRPNPVVFVSVDVVATELYLLYVNQVTHGDWFLSFAFPVVGVLGLILVTFTALTRYLHHGRLYAWGGTVMGLGVWTALLEFFLWLTFDLERVLSWSLCTMIPLCVLGLMLIVIAMVRPLRDSLERRFFF